MNAQITIYTNGKTTQTRIYAGNFERLSQNGTTTSYQYIYSPPLGVCWAYVLAICCDVARCYAERWR